MSETKPWAVPPHLRYKVDLTEKERLDLEKRKAELARELGVRLDPDNSQNRC